MSHTDFPRLAVLRTIARVFEDAKHFKYPGWNWRRCTLEASKDTRAFNIYPCCFGRLGGLGSAASYNPALHLKTLFHGYATFLRG
jgi:hypothetical protein